MLDLSPTKLIIIFVVVIVLLGPKRLPQLARQLGAGWRKIVGLQQQIERELRETMPDLPSSQDIVRFARSPVTMLNELAEFPRSAAAPPVEDPGAPPPGEGQVPADGLAATEAVAVDRGAVVPDPAPAPAGTPAQAATPNGTAGPPAPRPGTSADLGVLAADDPTMN